MQKRHCNPIATGLFKEGEPPLPWMSSKSKSRHAKDGEETWRFAKCW